MRKKLDPIKAGKTALGLLMLGFALSTNAMPWYGNVMLMIALMLAFPIDVWASHHQQFPHINTINELLNKHNENN